MLSQGKRTRKRQRKHRCEHICVRRRRRKNTRLASAGSANRLQIVQWAAALAESVEQACGMNDWDTIYIHLRYAIRRYVKYLLANYATSISDPPKRSAAACRNSKMSLFPSALGTPKVRHVPAGANHLCSSWAPKSLGASSTHTAFSDKTTHLPPTTGGRVPLRTTPFKKQLGR